MMRIGGRQALPLAVPVLCAAVLYARFFGGFWLGDDFGVLHRLWIAAMQGESWAQTIAQFLAAAPSEGAFYRPVMFASLTANAWLAGGRFAGFYAVSYAIHLANAVLLGILVVRLAAASGRDGRVSGAVAAAFFALCPALAEGVFWISARADASVTLLSLAGFLAWSRTPSSTARALALPLCLLPALGFKESAAVLPLQMALVAFAWPLRLTRAQVAAIGACFGLAALFLGIRAHLFGDVWQVYRSGNAGPLHERLWHAVHSIAPWWRALTWQTPGAAKLYAALVAGALACLSFAARGTHARLAAALLGAATGLALATLLNLGGMSAAGEGGRLTYSPIAWLALALGVAGAAPAVGTASDAIPSVRTTGLTVLMVAVLTGAWVLDRELRFAYRTERDVRALAAALDDWSAAHPGLTLLIVDGRTGPVVTLRNAQGGLVLPPVQQVPLLDRVLPTLPDELAARNAQLAAGLATRLAELRPSHVDAQMLERLLEPAAATWPAAYACWSSRERRIVALTAPEDPASRSAWVDALRERAAKCAHDAR